MDHDELKEKVYTLYKPSAKEEVYMRQVLAKYIFDFFRDYLLPHSGMDKAILDVGCGNQPFRSLIEELGFQYVGLDYKQNGESSVNIVEAIDSSSLQSNSQFSQFDFIICTEVLEHVANWSTAFDNLGALLKANGNILITCPHFYQLHEEPFDFWRPTPHAFFYYAEKCNLRVVDHYRAGTAWDVFGCALSSTYSSFCNRPLTKKEFFKFKIFSLAKKIMANLLSDRILFDKICVSSPLYLSNIAVLVK